MLPYRLINTYDFRCISYNLSKIEVSRVQLASLATQIIVSGDSNQAHHFQSTLIICPDLSDLFSPSDKAHVLSYPREGKGQPLNVRQDF